MKRIKTYAFVLGALLGLGALAMAADVTVSVQKSSKNGANTTRTSTGLTPSDTYKVRNNGKVILLFEKTGAGIATITVTTPGTVSGLAIADITFTVPASTGDVVAGAFQTSLFNDSNGDFSFTISDTVGLSFAAIGL